MKEGQVRFKFRIVIAGLVSNLVEVLDAEINSA